MSAKVAEKEAEEPFESFVDEEPIASVSINKYDPFQLKGNVDDTLVKLLEEVGFHEDQYCNNLKIGLGLIMCVVAAVSQFYKKDDEDWKFPKNWWF